MLQDKLADLSKAIEVKRGEVQTAYQAFDEKRQELASAEVDITDPNSEAVKAADDAMKPYSKASEELRTMEGQFERIALMIADGGEKAPSADVRRENEHDRFPLKAREELGQKAVESDAYKQLKSSGLLADGSQQAIGGSVALTDPMDRRDFKSLLTGTSDSAGGVLNVPQRYPGIAELPQLPLGIMDLITIGQTDSNAVEFVRILARTINAAEVAEASSTAEIGDGTGGTATAVAGGVKPESGLTFEEALEAVRTIAHFIPGTRNQLADAAFLQTLVESELLQGVQRRAATQVIQGNGTAPNIRGLKNTSGIASYTQGTDVADEPIADAIHRLLTLIRLAGFEPSAVGFHPTDWQEVRLSKDDNGNYIFGPPSLAGQMNIWGLPAVADIGFSVGTPMAGEWARALFLIREAAKVLISDSHKDWFVRNLLALLAEMRAVLVVMRPQAFGKVTLA
jgi:HK97 family phage major capsid protein